MGRRPRLQRLHYRYPGELPNFAHSQATLPKKKKKAVAEETEEEEAPLPKKKKAAVTEALGGLFSRREEFLRGGVFGFQTLHPSKSP